MDPLKIQRVLLNLLKNGFEAMPDGGKLSILVENDDENLCIEISDTGCGIPDEVQSELFLSVITTKLYGTGLGLPFCKKVVNQHGGWIKIRSDVSVGTTVSISIPLANDSMVDNVETLHEYVYMQA